MSRKRDFVSRGQQDDIPILGNDTATTSSAEVNMMTYRYQGRQPVSELSSKIGWPLAVYGLVGILGHRELCGSLVL